MITASIMDDVITAVWNRVLDAVAVFGDYAFIGEVWVGVAVLALAAGYIAFFVPWQWLRGALGFVVAIAIAMATGAQLMFNRMRREKSEHDKRQEFDNEVKRSNDNTGDRSNPWGRWF